LSVGAHNSFTVLCAYYFNFKLTSATYNYS